MAWFQIAIQLILNHRLALQAPNAPNIYLLNYHDCILTSKYCSWTNCPRGAVGYRFLFLFKLFVTLSINEDNFPPWDLENVPVNLIIIILFFQQIINLLSSFFFLLLTSFFSLLFVTAHCMPNKDDKRDDYPEDGEYDEDSTIGNDDDDPTPADAGPTGPVHVRSRNTTFTVRPGDTVEFPCVVDNAGKHKYFNQNLSWKLN